MTGGYVRVHRCITESPIWQCGPVVKVMMLAFLLKANFKAAHWHDGANEIEIPAGVSSAATPRWRNSAGSQ